MHHIIEPAVNPRMSAIKYRVGMGGKPMMGEFFEQMAKYTKIIGILFADTEGAPDGTLLIRATADSNFFIKPGSFLILKDGEIDDVMSEESFTQEYRVTG